MNDFPPEFKSFPKIARLNRECIVTEKIDGTNGCILVAADGDVLQAGSRTRWISPGKGDNLGFAGWVAANSIELRKLGPGLHFGEWWGLGIQRGYNLTERRFSLFNVSKWTDNPERPACCSVVPVLGRGNFQDIDNAIECMNRLAECGSVAAPGFMDPEGIVVFHTQGGGLFKKTIANDDKPKGANDNA